MIWHWTGIAVATVAAIYTGLWLIVLGGWAVTR